jgi:signal transduction histidine kinase
MTYFAVAEDRGRFFTHSVEPWLAMHGDRELLTQLLVNLIENALHHSPNGARLGISLDGGGRRPVVEVFDDGPGIPENERANAFRHLYRLGNSRSTPGNGLGLALVAAVAELHGARVVHCDKDPGLGVKLELEQKPSS